MTTTLIVGSTGLLGQAVQREAQVRGHDTIGIARNNAEICVDITNQANLTRAIKKTNPNIVINCAAIVDLIACEKDPSKAHLVNAQPAKTMANLFCQHDAKYIQISTDHFYVGDGAKKHTETAPITIINEYARTKFIAEQFSAENKHSLIVRTNIVGHRLKANTNTPTFAEWAIECLTRRQPLTLFPDVYSSPIHVNSLSIAIFDLIKKSAAGVINVASSEVSSKKDFILALAQSLTISPDWAVDGSGANRTPPRATSMGLDVSKAEALLGYSLPTLSQTISDVVRNRAR